MRLVLGTHSAKGLEVFRDVQDKVERAEIETRNQLSDRGDHQVSLFTDDEIAAMQQDAAGIGCPVFRREAEARIVEILAGKGGDTFSSIATDILEAVPMRLTQIKTLVNAMKSRGVIAFDLPPRKRVPQPGTRIVLTAYSI